MLREDDTSGDSGSTGSLMEVNSLVYRVPESLCLGTARSFNRNFFQRNSYSGSQAETMRIDINSSSLYACSKNSYLQFEVKLTASTGVDYANFGTGSAMNCFRSIVCRSKSGTEIFRNDALNVWSRINTLYSESESYLTKQGQLEGWVFPLLTNTSSVQLIASDRWTKFCIPLKRLGDFFNQSEYLPPALLSGMSIELVLEDYRRVFLEVGGANPTTITGYDIRNVSIMLDTLTLSDASQKTINQESASNGLEYTFQSCYISIVDQPSLQTGLSVQIRKAASECNSAMCVITPSFAQTSVKVCSFGSFTWDTLTWRWRLGGLYFSSSDFSDPMKDGVEAYQQAMVYSDTFKHPHMNPYMSLDSYKSFAAANIVSLEKNSSLQLSGSATNNSRVLELTATLEANSLARSVYVLLNYTTVVRAYLDNVSVTS